MGTNKTRVCFYETSGSPDLIEMFEFDIYSEALDFVGNYLYRIRLDASASIVVFAYVFSYDNVSYRVYPDSTSPYYPVWTEIVYPDPHVIP